MLRVIGFILTKSTIRSTFHLLIGLQATLATTNTIYSLVFGTTSSASRHIMVITKMPKRMRLALRLRVQRAANLLYNALLILEFVSRELPRRLEKDPPRLRLQLPQLRRMLMLLRGEDRHILSPSVRAIIQFKHHVPATLPHRF